MHNSVRPAIIRIGASGPGLNLTAIQVENAFIAPRRIARFGSVEVPISPVSTRPRRDIYTGATSQYLTHRVANRSSIQIWIRLSYERPVQSAAKRQRPTI